MGETEVWTCPNCGHGLTDAIKEILLPAMEAVREETEEATVRRVAATFGSDREPVSERS